MSIATTVARADQVVRAMLFDSVWPIAIGVGLGLAGAWMLAGNIVMAIAEPFELGSGTATIGVSVGIATAISDERHNLVARADLVAELSKIPAVARMRSQS